MPPASGRRARPAPGRRAGCSWATWCGDDREAEQIDRHPAEQEAGRVASGAGLAQLVAAVPAGRADPRRPRSQPDQQHRQVVPQRPRVVLQCLGGAAEVVVAQKRPQELAPCLETPTSTYHGRATTAQARPPSSRRRSSNRPSRPCQSRYNPTAPAGSISPTGPLASTANPRGHAKGHEPRPPARGDLVPQPERQHRQRHRREHEHVRGRRVRQQGELHGTS
jgi:hypothetical protein